MSTSQDPDILGESVSELRCRKCQHVMNTTGASPFAEVDCPKCGTRQPVPARLGTFLLLDKLGSGGMGTVYRAFDQSLGRYVALKVMHASLSEDQQFVESFLREARAAAAPNHPNIAQIYSFGQESGRPYIVMEFLDGGRLDEIMSSGKPLDEELVCEIGIGVAQGLRAANQKGIVHGDIKPANILFGPNRMPKVVDFGLANFIQERQAHQGEIWGTPYYIAPEKVRRQKTDCRSDIYSLGATLYHALVAKPPFDGKTALGVVQARLLHPPRDVRSRRPDIHDQVARTIKRMLEADPTHRYPTYDSLLSDLHRASNAVKRERTEPRQQAPAKTSKGVWIGMAAVVVVIVAAMIGIGIHNRAVEEQRRKDAERAQREAEAFQRQLQREEEERIRGQKEAERAALLRQQKIDEQAELQRLAKLAEEQQKQEEARRLAEERARKQREELAAQRQAREAELARQKKMEEEVERVENAVEANARLVKVNAFAEAGQRLKVDLSDIESEQAKQKISVAAERYERLTELKAFIIEQLNRGRLAYGWLARGTSRDVYGASEEGVKLSDVVVPWDRVSLLQFRKFANQFLTLDNFRTVRELAEKEVALAILFYEHGYLPQAESAVAQAARHHEEAEAIAKRCMPRLYEASPEDAPVSTDTSVQALPFVEGFEELKAGSISGQRGWQARGEGAVVQTEVIHSGKQALALKSAGVMKLLGSRAGRTVWTDMYVRLETHGARQPPRVWQDATVAFFLDSRGRLAVYDGTSRKWEKPAAKRVRPGAWVRITLMQDYGAQKWAVFLDGRLLAENLGFANRKSAFTAFLLAGGKQGTFLDDLTISTTKPGDLD
ncbi:MAG: protein kinase [Kiritimatiellae bacterium]|nr:protein kinase [Kiritimatiellia bacterium]